MRTCSITTRLTAKDASAASMAGGAVDKAGVNGPASPPNQPLQQLRNRQAAAAPASRAATWTQSSTVPGGWVRLCPSTSTPVVNSGTPIVTRARPLISPRTSKFPRTLPLLISDMVLAEVLNLASDNVSIFADGYAVWLWRQGRRGWSLAVFEFTELELTILAPFWTKFRASGRLQSRASHTLGSIAWTSS